MGVHKFAISIPEEVMDQIDAAAQLRGIAHKLTHRVPPRYPFP